MDKIAFFLLGVVFWHRSGGWILHEGSRLWMRVKYRHEAIPCHYEGTQIVFEEIVNIRTGELMFSEYGPRPQAYKLVPRWKWVTRSWI